MALSYAHGVIRWLSTDAATTVYTVSGLSFQPKALRFYWVGLRTDLSPDASASMRRGVGFAVSTSERRSVASFSEDLAGSATTATVAANDCVVCTVDGAGNRDGELDLNSITSDGFTLIVDDQGVASFDVFWEAWGGTDITVAAVGDFAEPAATGNVDYTVTGFTSGATDQVVMFAGVQSTAAINTALADDSGMHVGFAASTTAADNVTVCGNSDDGSGTMDTDGYCQDGECLSMITVAGGNPNARAALTAFGTNNFRLNWIARGVTGRKSIFLAIKGGAWKSGALTINGNSGGATATVSGLSFTPVGMSLIGRMTAENTSATSTANDRIGFGNGSSTTTRAYATCIDVDATASAGIYLGDGTDQVLAYTTSTGIAAIATAYDINAMNSDGFQLIVDTAGGVASEFIGYLTFGNAAASAAVTGTTTPSATEVEIVAGGDTTVITLTNDTWVTAGGTFDGQRQNIIDGCDSAQSELLGWNNVVQGLQGVGGVVRTSDTVVTITWDAFATYSITANETITVTVPGTALTGGSPIVATPTFQVTATVSGNRRRRVLIG
jgi:hypothetical protein